jgi:hypothetical protein
MRRRGSLVSSRAPLRAQRQAVGQARKQRQEHQHAVVQRAHAGGGVAEARGVERQMDRQDVDLARSGGQVPAAALCLGRGGGAQQIGEPAVGVLHPADQAALQHVADVPWEHETVDECGAEDAEPDLHDPRGGHVEDRIRLVHARESDQGCGVARQHQEVALRRAAEQRDDDAGRDPERHGEA